MIGMTLALARGGLWLMANRAWLSWVAAGLAVAVLVGLWRWERHDRIAAEKAEQAALSARDLAEADAARWQAAAEARDRALAERDQAIAAQSAAIERLRFDAARAETIAQGASAAAREAEQAADARIRELETEARAKPDDVRPLGPLVLKRVDGLFQ
ncbi:MAG TPA: hypothetical protein VMT54_08315 [Candidatus Cybelea sp.]|nr:hypothetical protein [Candidatus Cybelea sp.]